MQSPAWRFHRKAAMSATTHFQSIMTTFQRKCPKWAKPAKREEGINPRAKAEARKKAHLAPSLIHELWNRKWPQSRYGGPSGTIHKLYLHLQIQSWVVATLGSNTGPWPPQWGRAPRQQPQTKPGGPCHKENETDLGVQMFPTPLKNFRFELKSIYLKEKRRSGYEWMYDFNHFWQQKVIFTFDIYLDRSSSNYRPQSWSIVYQKKNFCLF